MTNEKRGRKPSNAPSSAKFLAVIKAFDGGAELPEWVTYKPEVLADNGLAIVKHREFATEPFWAVREDNPQVVELTSLKASGRRIGKDDIEAAQYASLNAIDYAPVTTEE